MSFQLNLPPSLVGRMAKEEGGEEEVEMGKPKREDWKKLKELEEARKAGTAPAMKDEEGKDINPHIPQYIMQPPWYYGSVQPTLVHQRTQSKEDDDDRRFQRWFKKGVKEGPIATKFRKGACENCGAMTHKKKDCLERPRKIGAKYTGDDIAPDEHVNAELSFDYDGKRDRWNGYDTTEHSRIVEEYTKIDEAKRQLKANKLDSAARDSRETREEEREAEDSEDENDEDKYADHVDMPGQKFETKQRITVRNLRIREDMAKYLYNLDPSSAYYDPKTRSMRDNPFSNTGKDDAEVTFAGDNFVRWSGDAHFMAEQQLFAWEAYEKGQEAHLQADPTKLELLKKEFKRKKNVYKDSQKQSILSKYGGQEHLDAPPKELLMAETENYVEYSRTGTVLKGQERAKIKSRYEEDIYLNNHYSVWGSYWKDGQWGYQCCHSLIKESYCTGSAGREAAGDSLSIMNTSPAHTATHTEEEDEEEAPPTSSMALPPVLLATPTEDRLQAEAPPPEAGTSTQEDGGQTEEVKQKSLMEQHLLKLIKEERKAKRREKKKQKKKEKKQRKKEERKKNKKKKKKHKKSSSSSSESSSGSSSESEDEDAARERRIKEAMKKQEAHEKKVEKFMAMDERKRPYNIMYDFKEPTEEEMEAFRRKKLRSDDPMAQFS